MNKRVMRAEQTSKPPRRQQGRHQSRFYIATALVIAAGMVGGFAYDGPKYLLHPTVQRPLILIPHTLVFVGWIVLYVAQTLLVRMCNVRLHRTLGWVGLGLAIAMPPVGIITALIMRRFDLQAFPSSDVSRDLGFLATPLADIIAFTPCAWLGIAMRKRPDYHRRLMFLATASIAEAGFGRLPIPGATTWFYLSNLPFYAAGIVHDRMTLGHVHQVYRWGVPLIVLDEAIAMFLFLGHPSWWLAICRALTGFAG